MKILTSELAIDMSKLWIEWAITAGRAHQSKQTGWIHYFHGDVQQIAAQTIPLYENAVFALALFRSKMVEQIQEGKELINRLLFFQNNENHFFPYYLHQYPSIVDRGANLHLLVPFYWIIKDFGHILGTELRDRLESASRLLLDSLREYFKDKNYPYFLKVKWAALVLAFSKLSASEEAQKIATEQLRCFEAEQLTGWVSTLQLEQLVMSLQLVYPSIKNSPWRPLWERMEQTWDSLRGIYVGPSIRQWQMGFEAQPHLYDLYGSYFSEKISARVQRPGFYHLYGACIYPTADLFTDCSNVVINGINGQEKWSLERSEHSSLCVIEKTSEPNPSLDNTKAVFSYIWGNLDKTHSFICQGGFSEKAHFQLKENETILSFDLPGIFVGGSEDDQREIAFYLDLDPTVRFEADSKPTNTFALDEEFVIIADNQRFKIKFRLLHGSGDFMGHIVRGNRPAQVLAKGDERFQVYDWMVFLRTVRRSPGSKIEVSILTPATNM